LPLGRGTLIFTGASGSLRGKPGYAQFAAAKAGLRMIGQSMARDYGPAGLHVAHVVIDGGIDGERLRKAAPERVAAAGAEGLLATDAIAEAYWQIHRQPRSAWSHEMDLRPFKEPF
jgi:NAD(P)-dependent dehydrogenase (short-subunit alcohol dehydrogenase family)